MEYFLVDREFTDNLSVLWVEILVMGSNILIFSYHPRDDCKDRGELRNFIFKLDNSTDILKKG